MSDATRPTLKISREGIVLIKSFEGFRPRAILRENGGWVIGYGHTLSAREGASVSEADAELLLRYDLLPVEKTVNHAGSAVLNQHQFDALVSFAFSVGVDRFQTSDVLGHLASGATGQAADALMGWPEPALPQTALRRRAAERALFVADPAAPVAVADLLIAPMEAIVSPAFDVAPADTSTLPQPIVDAPETDIDPPSEDTTAADPRGAAVSALLGEADEVLRPSFALPPAVAIDPVKDHGVAEDLPSAANDIVADDTVTDAAASADIPQPEAPAADAMAGASEDPAITAPDSAADPGSEATLEPEPTAQVEPEAADPDGAVDPTPEVTLEPEVSAAQADPVALAPVAAVDPIEEAALEPVAMVAQAEAATAAAAADAAQDATLEPEPMAAPPEPPSEPAGSPGASFDRAALTVQRYTPYGAAMIGPLPFLQPASEPKVNAEVVVSPPVQQDEPVAIVEIAVVSEVPVPQAFAAATEIEPLVLSGVDDFPASATIRQPWTLEERVEPIEAADGGLFGEELSLTQGGAPVMRHGDVEIVAPAPFDWSETGAFIIMGAVGLTAFGAAMAAFRLASEQSGGDETTIIAWVLAVIGAACVGVSSFNLYRRWGLPGGDN